jgi:hypothetical protein
MQSADFASQRILPLNGHQTAILTAAAIKVNIFFFKGLMRKT